MTSLISTVSDTLSPETRERLRGELGVDKDKFEAALPAALAMLTTGLERNAKQPEGAEKLAGALDRDHDGGLLDDLAGALGPGLAEDGTGILKHILGGRRDKVENAVSTTSGLDAGSVGSLLAMLAPVVMGALGRAKKDNGLDIGDLAGFLGQERQTAEKNAPSGVGSLTKILDFDGDGDVTDDVLDVVGSLFGGRK